MRIKFFKNIGSTQEEAKRIAKLAAPAWSCIVAETQTQGHGKGKSDWFSPKGSLYFSIVLPQSSLDDLQTLTILAAFVIARILKEDYKLEPFIKLPNDVLVQGRKICGILTENIVIGNRAKISVMGIGLNTNNTDFQAGLKESATSIKIQINKEVDNKEILNKIIKGLRKQMEIIKK